MARAITKQEIRRNPLAECVATVVRFVQLRRSVVLAVLAAIALAAGTSAGYWWYQGRQEDEASRALAMAYAGLRGDKPGAPGNPEEALRRHREVAQQYRGTRSGEEALIRVGNLQFGADKVDGAAGSFEEYLTTYPRGRFRMMAALGKAYAQETRGDLQGAAQTLSQILESDKNDPLAGEAYMALGRMYEGLKKPEEAMRVYGQVVEQFTQTQWAQHALQRMGIIKKK